MASYHSQGCWSDNNILRLLENIENNVQCNDNETFKTTLSNMDWETIAFNHFSAEMCKGKWLEISRKLRKLRTLKELVLEAKECVKIPTKCKKYEKHPDFPKKPLTAYIRFYKENWAEYSQEHPELNNKELTKILTEKYKQLPEDIKQKYIEDFQKEKREFEENLACFKKNHPDLAQVSKTSDVYKRCQTKARKKLQGNVKNVRSLTETDGFSEKVKFHGEPKKPPMNGYHKFHQDLWSSRELQHLPLRERMVEIGRRWQHVPQSMKEQYIRQAEELQKQYRVDLDLWLMSLSPKEYAAYKETSYGKRKNITNAGGPNPKFKRIDQQSPSAESLQESLQKKQGLKSPGRVSPDTAQMAIN
ncbi:upstream-binding factor 1-like protein 1 [Callospermophilus lateralis]|uniref:upstream-binding factor 1-like protein 1 n=1 Tax=Callospermophilus lateralis TaxID=76772 RepID=UPI004038D52A